MKKLVLALIVALTLVPFSAFGLEMMTDDGLKDVTAQAGVAIAIDDVVIEQYIGSTKYIDSDGIGEQDFGGDSTLGGALVIGDRYKVTEINAIYTGAPGSGGFGRHDIHNTYNHFDVIAPLTIDIGTCPTLTYGCNVLKQTLNAIYAGYGITDAASWRAAGFDRMFHLTYDEVVNETAVTNVVGVIITLPTVEIYNSDDIYSISAEVVTSADGAQAATTDYFNNGRDYIRIYKGESSTAICGGRLEIAPK